MPPPGEGGGYAELQGWQYPNTGGVGATNNPGEGGKAPPAAEQAQLPQKGQGELWLRGLDNP
jgi:hypothetical protein